MAGKPIRESIDLGSLRESLLWRRHDQGTAARNFGIYLGIINNGGVRGRDRRGQHACAQYEEAPDLIRDHFHMRQPIAGDGLMERNCKRTLRNGTLERA
jgi:hypothetical protein